MKTRFLPRLVSVVARFFLLPGLAALWLLVLPAGAGAQTTFSGGIAGRVMDATGAAIPGATVTVRNIGNGATQTLTTGSEGEYRLSLIQPGNYSVTANATNFRPGQINATVAVGQTATADLTLQVAVGTQTVQVQGTAIPLLQPENADLGTTISMQQVQNLPNPGGDITYYINLTQGVVMNTQGGYGSSSAFGLPATSNSFTINGAQDNDPFLNLNNSGPSNLLLGANDIDQVNIVANAYSSQYGGLGGVQENIITRSGANKFHGNLNYYWTNSDLNANNWFNNFRGSPQAFSNANQWGAAIGGPIVRDKAFFFVNYEGLRFVTAPSNLVVLPSPSYQAAVLGNLAAVGNAAEIPFYQKIFAIYNAAPGAGIATPYQGTTWADAYQANPKNLLTETLVTARYDQKLGPNDSMFIHFKRDHGLQPTYVDPLTPAFDAHSDQPDYEGQLVETHTFSPHVVNQFLLSGMWYSALFVAANPQLAKSTFPYSLDFAYGDGSFTDINLLGFFWPQGRNVTQYQINDDVSWTKGKHTTSFGFVFKRNDVTDYDLGIYTYPFVPELGPASNGPLAPAFPANGALGDSFGEGLAFEAIQNFPQRLSEPIAVYNLGFYAQDEWKISPNFQLNLGVRVEHNSNPVCVTNCFARFADSYTAVTADLDTPYNSVLVTGQRNALVDLQKVTIDPRIGFTFSPPNHPKMLFRGGFGIFTDTFPATVADNLLSNPPLNPQFATVGDLADPAQAGSFANTLSAANQAFQTQFAAGGSFNSISATTPIFSQPNVYNADRKIHYPTYEQWSLQWQQQLGGHAAFQIAYVGNHGYHEPVVNNGANTFYTPPAGTAPLVGVPTAPALPAFAQILEIQSAASSNYNGLVSSLRFQSHHVTAMLNYTYSHALDEISNGGILPFGDPSFGNSNYPIDPFNLALQNYGNADYDLRHSLNANYLVEIPHIWGPSALTGGWRLAGTVFWHTGFPFSVTDSNLSSTLAPNYGGSALALVVDPSVPHHCGKGAILTGCFGGDATAGTLSPYFADPIGFGGQRRNQFFGPGFFNTDFTLMKGFKIREAANLEFGLQGYNILNHPNFANPSFNFDNPSSFGFVQRTVSVPTSVFGSFLGGDASPRILQLKGSFTF